MKLGAASLLPFVIRCVRGRCHRWISSCSHHLRSTDCFALDRFTHFGVGVLLLRAAEMWFEYVEYCQETSGTGASFLSFRLAWSPNRSECPSVPASHTANSYSVGCARLIWVRAFLSFAALPRSGLPHHLSAVGQHAPALCCCPHSLSVFCLSWSIGAVGGSGDECAAIFKECAFVSLPRLRCWLRGSVAVTSLS